MKSLILTSLYLAKDTVYRWKERPSSPLSRLLVVFFLSLCSLSFLSNYILTTKTVQDDIRRSGGDLVFFHETVDGSKTSQMGAICGDLAKFVDVDIITLRDVFVRGTIENTNVAIVEYGDESLKGLKDLPLEKFPYLGILPQESPIPEGPSVLSVEGYHYDLVVKKLSEDHPLLKHEASRGLVLVPEGTTEALQSSMYLRKYIIKLKEMTYANVAFVDSILKNLCKLEGMTPRVFSAEPLLKKLDLVMSNQQECRAGFSIGIAVIVGILLTALASMEFRQNEYVYTLMKSFGVRPILLVLTFIAENIVLVGASFVIAVVFFIKAQEIIMGELFKMPGLALRVGDLRADLMLLGFSLLICVLVSSIPIVLSAYREIGRVLK